MDRPSTIEVFNAGPVSGVGKQLQLHGHSALRFKINAGTVPDLSTTPVGFIKRISFGTVNENSSAG